VFFGKKEGKRWIQSKNSNIFAKRFFLLGLNKVIEQLYVGDWRQPPLEWDKFFRERCQLMCLQTWEMASRDYQDLEKETSPEIIRVVFQKYLKEWWIDELKKQNVWPFQRRLPYGFDETVDLGDAMESLVNELEKLGFLDFIRTLSPKDFPVLPPPQWYDSALYQMGETIVDQARRMAMEDYPYLVKEPFLYVRQEIVRQYLKKWILKRFR